MIPAARQGDTFGRVVDAYARTRPAYPVESFAALARRVPEGALALDVAAGTGVATHGLLQAGARVLGIEPDLAMVRRARASLRDRSRFVAVVAGRAEALPVARASAHLVTAAQSYHWFEARAALDEFARVLAPGGALALLWNVVETDPFVDAVRRLVRRRVEGVRIPVTMAMIEPPVALAEHGAFELEPPRVFPHRREMDADRYVAYAFSWSYCGGALAPAEREPFEDELRALIDLHHGSEPWSERLLAVVHTAVRRG